MYRLYYSPGTASMAVHQLLIELKVPFELELIDFNQTAQKSARYLQLNPKGQVPLLFDGEQYIREVGAIILYLTERHPQARLAPLVTDPQRGLYLQGVVQLVNNLAPQFRQWFYAADLGFVEYPGSVKNQLQQNIENIWQELDQQLNTAGPYMLGAEFSSLDILLLMYMRWSRNMPKTALSWPALANLATLVRARPSWLQLNKTEGLTEWLS